MQPIAVPLYALYGDEREALDAYMKAMLLGDPDAAQRAIEELNRLPREWEKEKLPAPRPINVTLKNNISDDG